MKKYLEYMNAAERKIADKLNTLTNIDTFWDDVRKFTKNVHSDRSISIWQSLAEIRFDELRTGCEDVRSEIEEYGKPIRYYTYDYSKEVFIKEA
jgi:hypothetical protein